MKQKNIVYHLSLRVSILLSLFALLFTSCSVEDPPVKNPEQGNQTLWILCEGTQQQNTSTLARYDVETGDLDKDYFKTVNQRGLGDTGNDMILYGSKVYIAVALSSTIEVVDAVTGHSIRRIDMKQQNGSAKQPRQMASHGGKVYVTSYDDTVTRIDTASLQIDGMFEVGLDPDGICITNNKVWVANSGGLNWQNGYNNTVSVINIAAFTEEKVYEVGTNPVNMQADSQGDIYLSILGNWGDIPQAFKRIDPKTDSATTIEKVVSPDRFVIWKDKAFIICGSYGKPYKVVVLH